MDTNKTKEIWELSKYELIEALSSYRNYILCRSEKEYKQLKEFLSKKLGELKYPEIKKFPILLNGETKTEREFTRDYTFSDGDYRLNPKYETINRSCIGFKEMRENYNYGEGRTRSCLTGIKTTSYSLLTINVKNNSKLPTNDNGIYKTKLMEGLE